MTDLIKLALERYADSNINENLKEEFLQKAIPDSALKTNAFFVRTTALFNKFGTICCEVHPGTRCIVTCNNGILNHELGIVTEKNNVFCYPKFVDVEIPHKGIFTVTYNNGTNEDPDFNLEIDFIETTSKNLCAFKRMLSDLTWSNGLGMDLVLKHNKEIYAQTFF